MPSDDIEGCAKAIGHGHAMGEGPCYRSQVLKALPEEGENGGATRVWAQIEENLKLADQRLQALSADAWVRGTETLIDPAPGARAVSAVCDHPWYEVDPQQWFEVGTCPEAEGRLIQQAISYGMLALHGAAHSERFYG